MSPRYAQKRTSFDYFRTMSGVSEGDVLWYVMRVTYQRELQAYDILRRLNIESYVPLVKVRRRKSNGVFYWREESAIHNYIFIHTSLKELKRLKKDVIPFMRYMMASDGEGNMYPQYVEQKQMEDFILISKSAQAKYLSPDIDLKAGDRVRILVGEFQGVEGVFTKISKKHEKRVVVKIEGIAAVATKEYSWEDVERA